MMMLRQLPRRHHGLQRNDGGATATAVAAVELAFFVSGAGSLGCDYCIGTFTGVTGAALALVAGGSRCLWAFAAAVGC